MVIQVEELNITTVMCENACFKQFFYYEDFVVSGWGRPICQNGVAKLSSCGLFFSFIGSYKYSTGTHIYRPGVVSIVVPDSPSRGQEFVREFFLWSRFFVQYLTIGNGQDFFPQQTDCLADLGNVLYF